MNQKNSIIILITGLAGFLGALAAFLSSLTSWDQLTAPAGVANILVMVVTLLMTVAGALGTQMPRNSSRDYKDRMLDKINDEAEKRQ